MTRRKTRAARPAPPRPRASGAFGSKMVPRTSPAFRGRGPRSRATGFTLRSKLRFSLLSTTLAAILLFRLCPPLQPWLEAHGVPGRLLILGVLCLPTAAVLLLHRRQRS